MCMVCRLGTVVYGTWYEKVMWSSCMSMVWVMVRHVCVVGYGGLWPYGPVKGGMSNVICMLCWSAVKRVRIE